MSLWDHICKRFAQAVGVLAIATVLGGICHGLHTVGPARALIGASVGLAIYMFSNGIAAWVCEK